MSVTAYDALVIGAGYIGCAVAYYLTVAGLRTALIDRGGVAAGASKANYGNIQVQDAELEHSLNMVRAGYACFEGLEEELGSPVGLRRIGGLLLIETESQWRTMAARLPALHAAGIQAEMVEAGRLRELEPLLDSSTVLGACYHEQEGQVNPFQLMWAFVRGGCRRGLSLHFGHEVTSIDLQGGRVRGLSTNKGQFAAPILVLCTGAWTPMLGQRLGKAWDIPHVHGQALVTEASTLRLRNHISSAAFFESMHEEEAQPESPQATGGAVLAISQTASGHFLLGEAAQGTARVVCDHWSPAAYSSRSTLAGQTAIARLVGRHFPALRRLNVLRGWAAPVAFTPNGLPFLGSVAGIDGLIVATAFKSTVIVTPLVGRTVARLVMDDRPLPGWAVAGASGEAGLDLSPFSPDRILN